MRRNVLWSHSVWFQSVWTAPGGQRVQEGRLAVVRAQVLQLFGIAPFQTLNQRLQQHEALFAGK